MMMTAFRADRMTAIAEGNVPTPRRAAEPEQAPRPWPRFEATTAAACLLVALLMRWQAADHGLSFDETWMLAGAAGHGSDCLQWTPDELRPAPTSPTALEHAASPLRVWTRGVIMHPPLHMATLWFWRALFGESDWIAAMYSAVWSIVANGFLFAAIRLQAGVAPAALVALTMALSPVQIQLGTEVRGYGMMIGLAACAAWQMVRMESLGATRLGVWMLGLTLLPLQLTHYFAAGACTAVCLWAMLRLTRSLRWHFIAAVACAAAITLVSWLPFALDHLRRAGSGDVSFLQATAPFWIGAGKAGLPLVSLKPPTGFYGSAILLEWAHAPGFFPRPAMLMETAPPEAVHALAAASPDHRLWLVTVGRDTAGTEMPDWLHDLLPTATLVRPPVVVPAGQSGIQPEPAVALWLLELNEPPPAGRSQQPD